ncbi:replication-relaxation family protein [Micromonospora sp. LOL_021]|uniref:replication-relaxation family protein n=1 Tax=Micromonospora sp. LOL_021 TaxID=3345417 RepID=UPI003A83E09C
MVSARAVWLPARPTCSPDSRSAARHGRASGYRSSYVIDQLGAEVVAAGRDERPPRRDHARVERRRWTSSRTLEHRLGVNGFFTDLAGYARTHPEARLGRWLSEAACQRSGAFTRPEDPGLVRAFQPRVRPDGYGLWTVRGVGVPFFVEFDTGGEQLSVLTRKLSGYEELFGRLGRVWPDRLPFDGTVAAPVDATGAALEVVLTLSSAGGRRSRRRGGEL